MDPRFADWYRITKVEPDEAILARRWSGVEAAASNADNEDLADLVRLYHGRATRSESFLGWFREGFKTSDAAFPLHSNDLELRILAGACLSVLLGDQDRADFVAACIVCGTLSGRDDSLLVDLVPDATNLRARNSLAIRSSSDQVAVTFPNALDRALYDSVAGSDLTVIAGPLGQLLDTVNALSKSSTTLNSNIASLVKAQKAGYEEINVLWWVFNQYSTELDKRYATITAAQAALIVGKELADRTQFPVGLLSAEAFIRKVIDGTKGRPAKIPLSTAVNEAPAEWRAVAAKTCSSVLDDICLIHTAILKSSETGDAVSWLSAFQKVTGCSAATELAPAQIGLRFYDEIICQRTLAALEAASG